MADEQNEKTEEATPKRREKERDRGHISKSQDFTSSLVLTLGVALIFALGNSMLEKIQEMLHIAFVSLIPSQISEDDFVSIMGPYFYYYVSIIALFFVLLAVGAVLILRFQTGALFAKEALKPNFKKLAPSSLLKALKDKFNDFIYEHY